MIRALVCFANFSLPGQYANEYWDGLDPPKCRQSASRISVHERDLPAVVQGKKVCVLPIMCSKDLKDQSAPASPVPFLGVRRKLGCWPKLEEKGHTNNTSSSPGC